MLAMFWFCAAFFAYTLAGYPFCLALLARVRRKNHRRAAVWPSVSVIIPAHNEGPLLREKVLNTLELSYPEGKKEVIIACDGSEPATVETVRSFAKQGVKWVGSSERQGKHHVQMLARDISCGEILVFTDAGVRLETQALETIVSNFADDSVGCVSSEDQVLRNGHGRAGEGAYVDFEMWLRRLESQVNSLVSASGSFFAARRELCDVWHPGQSSDFFIPLHAAQRHLRSVIDPECRGNYGLARKSNAEFLRKVRTIVHGLDVLFTHRTLMNPFRYPVFSWQLASHKLFRWLVPFAALGLWISNCFLWNNGLFYRVCLVLQTALYAAGLLALAWERLLNLKFLKLAAFFVMGNLATITAWIKFCSGEKYVSWQPTRRD
jgi:glycosyltransferase involved in cell wall biosynthesis